MVDTTFTGAPEWYGGEKGVLKPYIERQIDLSRAKFQPYNQPRVAGFSPQQNQSFGLAERYAKPAPQFPQAQGAIQGAIGQDIYGQNVQPYIQQGAKAPGQEEIGQFLNPYRQEVLENIGKMGSRNLIENILPNIQNRFIGAGQYGSSQHQNLTNRGIRDTQEAVTQAQANALHGGFNTALQAAQGQQARQFEAGQLAGTSAEKQAQRQLIGAEALQNLAGAEQQQGIRGIGLLNQLGGQQQAQEQNLLNVPYQEFQRELEFPYYQAGRLGEAIRGLPSPGTTQFGSSVNPVSPSQPQASPYSQMGGLLGGLTGAYQQRQGYAKGGEVKKLSHHRHYADGGSLSPIQQGANAAIDTAELKSMRDQATNLSRPQVDPFWASIARAGFNVAANRNPGVLANLGEAGGAGLSEYHSQLAHQDKRGLQSAKIMEMIDSTRRLQEERNRSHQLEREKFGQHQKEFGMTHDLAREKLEHEKSLYEQGLKGSKKSDDDLFKKSNQAAIEEARKSISTLPALKSNLKQLHNLAEKLDTGPTKGRIAKTSSTLGSLAGVGSSQDIDTFDSLTNSLVLDLGNQLKGSQVALGKLKIIEQSKPQLTKVKGGNLEIISHMQDLAHLAEEKARFINKSIKSKVNAIDAEDAFNQYADAKLEFEEVGKKFPNKPDDFLEGLEFEKGSSTGESEKSPENDLSSMSDEELMKIAGSE